MGTPLGGQTANAPWRPADSDDTHAVAEEEYLAGGFRTVADLAERNSITQERRRIGMMVRVLDADGQGTQQFYTLEGGISDAHWIIDTVGAAVFQVLLDDAIGELQELIEDAGHNVHFVATVPGLALGEHRDIAIWFTDPAGTSFYQRILDQWILAGRISLPQPNAGIGGKWLVNGSLPIDQSETWIRVPLNSAAAHENRPGEDDIIVNAGGGLSIKRPTDGATLLANLRVTTSSPEIGDGGLGGVLGGTTELPQPDGVIKARLIHVSDAAVSEIAADEAALSYEEASRLSLGDGLPLAEDDDVYLEVWTNADLELLTLQIDELDTNVGAGSLSVQANQGLPGTGGSGGTGLTPQQAQDLADNTAARHAPGDDASLLDSQGNRVHADALWALLNSPPSGVNHADQLDVDHPVHAKAQSLFDDLDARAITPTDEIQTVASDGQRTFNLTKPASAVIGCCIGGAPQRVIDFNHPTVVIEGSSALTGQRVVFGLMQETTA